MTQQFRPSWTDDLEELERLRKWNQNQVQTIGRLKRHKGLLKQMLIDAGVSSALIDAALKESDEKAGS